MSFPNNAAAEIGQAAAQWQKMWTDSWSQVTKSTVSSEGFTAASGAYMDWMLASQKMVAETSGQVMETLDIPRRSDLARLAAQIQSVETRLLDQEEINSDIRQLLLNLNAKLDKLAAAEAAPPEAAAPQAPEAPASPVEETIKVVGAEEIKEVVSQAVADVEVIKADKPARKNAKKGKK